mmetsp:Transcript_13239/g.24806  ORF Transcript_13239/g.24806 Transcript_13239/m.24806 type:complete len:873 (+) Transcript_13239:2-2620(+)
MSVKGLELMVSSVSSDRSLAAQSERLLSKQVYENSTLANRRKRRRRNWTEFVKTAKSGPSDATLSAEVKEWFRSLDPQQRQDCLSYEHSWLCFVMQRMFHRKVKDGEGSFSLQEDRLASGDIDVHQDCFYFQRKEHEVYRPGAKHNLEMELEGMIRFAEGEEYLDTFTVSQAAASDPERILQLLNDLTQERAFEIPCRFTYDPYFKMWTLESPIWFCATTFNSIATWICCVLEKAIWSKYWEKVASDPRRAGEAHATTECGSSIKYFSESNSLNEFWNSLSRVRKAELIGDTRELTQDLRKFQLDDFINEKPEPAVFVSSLFMTSGISGLLPANLVSHKLAELKRKVNLYNSEDSARDIIQIALERPSEEFFEYLFLSPLDRAGSRLDQLCRKVGVKIQAALSHKMAEDLLISEWSSKPSKGKPKKKRKKQGKRRHSEDSSSTSASGRVNFGAAEEEFEENFGRKLVASLLTDIIDDIKEPHVQVEVVEGDDDNFMTVTHAKKKGKQPQKVHRKKDKFKNKQKKQRNQAPKILNSPIAKSNSSAFVQWETSDSPAKVLSTSEFPPLAPAVQVKPTYDKLTAELEKMQKKIEDEVEDLKPARLSLMDKVNEIVGSIFPGSFIQLYGSYATGLALPYSDIDIVLVNTGAYNSETLVTSLKYLGTVLSNCPWVNRIYVLDKAAVPVVKLTAHGSYFGCDHPIEADISIDEYGLEKPGNSGMATTLMTRSILDQFPQVAALCIFLKQLLHKNKLNSAFKGGVSSYTTTLWVASYLVSLKEPAPSGALLMGFLDFFANTFNPNTQAVSFNEGGFVPRGEAIFGAVETRDPISLANNTSRSSFMIESVQELFKKAHSRLEQWTTYPKKAGLSSLLTTL